MRTFSYQLYSSRNFPPLSDTLKMLGRLGYKQVEGFGDLFTEDVAAAALKRTMDAIGLAMPTAHVALDMIRDEPIRVMFIAKTLGIKAIFVPHIAPTERPTDANGWVAFGRGLAKAARPFWEAGLQVGWHNHDFEMADLGGGDRPLDLILQGDDQLKLELDIAWIQIGGQDPLDWISRYSSRMLAAHVKDIAPKGDCADEDGWADVGHGIMDWSVIIAALDKTGTEYFVIEHDNPSDHERFARRSLASAKRF